MDITSALNVRQHLFGHFVLFFDGAKTTLAKWTPRPLCWQIMTRSIPDLISLAGGPKAIALESRKSRHRVTYYAVQKWSVRGIPDEHWDLMMRLTGASLEEIYKANREFKNQKLVAA